MTRKTANSANVGRYEAAADCLCPLVLGTILFLLLSLVTEIGGGLRLPSHYLVGRWPFCRQGPLRHFMIGLAAAHPLYRSQKISSQ